MLNHVFIDLDGVLADFASAAFDANGHVFDPDAYPKGEWELRKPLNIPTDAEFWKVIDARAPLFWPDLKPYPWLSEMLAMAYAHFHHVSFLTSPSRHHSSYSGKRQWAQKHLPEHANLILCRTKNLLAREDRLLIDDSDKNVGEWEAAGGKAILFPRVWNAQHAKAAMPMVHVGMELSRLLTAVELAA